MTDSPLPQTRLASGYSIPRIVNGGWQLAANHSDRPPETSRSIDDLLKLADLGLTAFDCADIYPGVESLFGRFIEAWRARGGAPDAIRIHTKYVPDRETLTSVDRQAVTRAIDRSLSRLGVERLDLVQFYWWDYTIPGWIDVAGWLTELRQEGKIRCLGVTNFDTALLRTLVDAGIDVVANQVQYSLLDRRPEASLVDFCADRGIALMCYGGLAGGFLTQRWLGASDPRNSGSALGNRSLVKYALIIDEFGGWTAFQSLLAELDAVALKHQTTIAPVAVAWLLSRAGVNAVIVGARTARHAGANLRAAQLKLDAADHARIEAVLAQHPGPGGDVFGLERIPGGRHARIMKTELSQIDAQSGGRST